MANFKRVLTLVLALLLLPGILDCVTLSAGAAETASGTCGEGLTWALTEDGTLIISGTGSMLDYACSDWNSNYTPWYDYRDQITAVVVEEGITYIGKDCFRDLANMTEISLPDSLTEIGINSFRNCASLETVDLPEGLTKLGWYTFSNCTSLKTVVIPDGCTTTGGFNGCTSLTSVNIPKAATVISYSAYNGCSALKEIEIHDGITEIQSSAFRGCASLTELIIPDSVTYISDWAFADCTGLTSIVIPENVEYLGVCTFENCTNLKTIQLPQKMDMSGSFSGLGGSNFMNCTSLTEVNIPEGVEELGQEMFLNCSSLPIIVIPDSVTDLAMGAFGHCVSLRQIYFLGDAPEFARVWVENGQTHIFADVTASVYYPAGNATWTEEVMQDYGGNLTWKALSTTLGAPELKVTNVASSGKPKLSWSAVERAVKYRVYRATGKNGAFKLLSTTTGTSLTNTSTTAGTLYYYYVEAVDADGYVSRPSAAVSRTCDLARPVITLSNVASTGKVKISWEKIEGAVKYEVYRSTDNKTWSKLSTVSGTSLTNTSTTAGTLYYYKVKAIASNSGANSAYSTVKSRRCDLARPSISSLTIISSTGKIKVKWGAVDGAVKYALYCSTDNKTWTKLVTTTGTSINHNSAVAGTRYYYKVYAIASNSAANSAYSTVKDGYCDLARPTLTVKLNSKDKPVLTWNEIDGAVKYAVYRSTDNKTWTKMITTTGTKLTHSSAVAGTTYYYKVRAIASVSNANSAYSTVKTITAG